MRGYLLDTYTWLWFLAGGSQLGATARSVLEDRSSELFLSAASGWELAIKISLGKLSLSYPLETVLVGDRMQVQRLRHHVHWLEIQPKHCQAVSTLEFHHRDPFDRLLVAQTLTEGLGLLSAERAFDDYGVARIWH